MPNIMVIIIAVITPRAHRTFQFPYSFISVEKIHLCLLANTQITIVNSKRKRKMKYEINTVELYKKLKKFKGQNSKVNMVCSYPGYNEYMVIVIFRSLNTSVRISSTLWKSNLSRPHPSRGVDTLVMFSFSHHSLIHLRL